MESAATSPTRCSTRPYMTVYSSSVGGTARSPRITKLVLLIVWRVCSRASSSTSARRFGFCSTWSSNCNLFLRDVKHRENVSLCIVSRMLIVAFQSRDTTGASEDGQLLIKSSTSSLSFLMLHPSVDTPPEPAGLAYRMRYGPRQLILSLHPSTDTPPPSL
jgi:hypothetical protein